MATQINGIQDEEHTTKLAYIQQQTKVNEIETIKYEISFNYQYLQVQKRDPTFLLNQSVYIGSADGDPNLPNNYKNRKKKFKIESMIIVDT
jgi:hypothetical protein